MSNHFLSSFESRPVNLHQNERAVVASRAPLFFLSGPTQTIVARDEGRVIRARLADRSVLPDLADAALRTDDGFREKRLMVGALPFAEKSPVRLFCPRRVSRTGRWWIDATRTPKIDASAAPTAPRRAAAIGPREPQEEGPRFVSSVRAAVDAIARGDLRKVVLSRVKRFRLAQSPDIGALLQRLRVQDPLGFTFAVALPQDGERPTRTLVGVSPELLLSRRGARVVSAPLAGSAPRAMDDGEDRRRAAHLLGSPKDRHEHRLVVEQILENLQPFTRDMRWNREPELVATSSMWHLSTRIEGVLRSLDISALRLALALHPTPAVCGSPSREAAAWIDRAEPFDRGYFTGTLGYMDTAGDGDWVVTIRCAELGHSHANVFAGAGIVAGSEAEAELAETEAKMSTMLKALGLAAAP
ncbi:MAG TPA: isochorismate synthase [Polyangiaceae bacterium]|nr:isochorismate synthase [Polyangiaceae bacterium]